jgi:hypothetical protein
VGMDGPKPRLLFLPVVVELLQLFQLILQPAGTNRVGALYVDYTHARARARTRTHAHTHTHTHTHSHICTTTGLIPPSTRLGPTSAPGLAPTAPSPNSPGRTSPSEPHVHPSACAVTRLAATVPSVLNAAALAVSDCMRHAAHDAGHGAREGRRVRGTNLRPSSCRPCRRACGRMRSFPGQTHSQCP